MEKAQKGDLIRIVNVHDDRYNNGDIFEVGAIVESGVYTKTSEGHRGYFIRNEEYIIHRKAGEEDSVGICEKCASFAGTENEGSFCSNECIERYQKRIADLADEIREPFRKYREEKAELDAVNSPNHYTQGKFETIEIIAEITKGYSDGYVAYCVGNALKYLARAPFKHGEPSEDLSKAAKYLAFASEYLDAKSTQD